MVLQVSKAASHDPTRCRTPRNIHEDLALGRLRNAASVLCRLVPERRSGFTGHGRAQSARRVSASHCLGRSHRRLQQSCLQGHLCVAGIPRLRQGDTGAGVSVMVRAGGFVRSLRVVRARVRVRVRVRVRSRLKVQGQAAGSGPTAAPLCSRLNTSCRLLVTVLTSLSAPAVLSSSGSASCSSTRSS